MFPFSWNEGSSAALAVSVVQKQIYAPLPQMAEATFKNTGLKLCLFNNKIGIKIAHRRVVEMYSCWQQDMKNIEI